MNLSDMKTRIPPTFERRREPVEELRTQKYNVSATGDYFGNSVFYTKGEDAAHFYLKSGVTKTIPFNGKKKFQTITQMLDFIGENLDFNFEEFVKMF